MRLSGVLARKTVIVKEVVSDRAGEERESEYVGAPSTACAC